MDEFDEFEFQYADELELMDEDEGSLPRNASTSVVNTPAPSLNLTPQAPQTLPSPQFSQISGDSAHRRLFDTGVRPAVNKRFASTPFPGGALAEENNPALTEIQNIGLARKRRLDLSPPPSAYQQRKSRIDDIFGDIYDIEEEEFRETHKKQKTDEERDLELIDTIVKARKALNSQLLVPRSCNIDRLEAMDAFKKQNLSYSVPKWPFVKVVRSDKERIFVRFHSEEFETKQINEIKGRRLELLGENKRQIWDAASEINMQRMVDRPVDTEEAVLEIMPPESNLWVEKYRPRKYIDLLSDETCNKNLLRWIKLWDKIVFNREVKKFEPKATVQQKFNTFNKKTGRFEQTGGWTKRNKTNLNTDLDELNRPIQKLVLLAGPPGLGKTTLAHTIARHAGYEPLEVNASDDRTPEAFRLALENGTQMQNVFAGHKRPNCLILDEIDGAPTASIEFLLRFVAGAVKERGKKGDQIILRRPIICICNELYVASLRQLRQQAFVITVPATDSARLVERLLRISREQRIKTDQSTLFALAEKTGNDIRSCLSLLQFFSGKKHELSMLDVIRSNIGQKDQHKELFKIWNTIFQIQRPTRALTESGDKNYGPMTTLPPALRARYVLQVVHMGSDYEKLAQGVFENYLNQKMPDPNMNGVREAADWFTFNDQLQSHIQHTQNYSTYSYLSYAFVYWHLLFATYTYPKITYPSKSFEVSQRVLTVKNILTALRRNLDTSKRGVGDTPTCMFLDSLPLVKRILCPNLRPVSLQLLTPREKIDVRYTVEIMADLGLSYIQLKAVDGTYQYQIEPDIESLCKFDEINCSNGRQLSYWCKQLIAREVEVEKMKRIQEKTNVGEKRVSAAEPKGKKKLPTKNADNVPNFLKTLQPKKIQAKPQEEVTRKDFFGRVTAKPASTVLNNERVKSDNIVKSPIWYCYKEGFNNAVRKNVTISDLV